MNDSFILYTSDYQLIEGLTDEQLGQLTRALFIYARDGEVINLEPVVRMAFVFIKDKIDRNQQKYQKKCERNRENIRKRWNKSNTNNTKENERIPNDTSVYERIPNDTTRYLYDSDSDSDSDSDASKLADNNKPSKEGIESASVKTEAPGGGKGSKFQNIDYAAVKEYWNRKHDETKSAMPPITLMTENRKVMVKARVRQCKGDVKTLYRVIDIAMASDFMNGNNKHGWLGKFDWIFGNEQNFAKVLEGNFNNDPASQQPQSAAARAQDPAATARPSIGELYEQAKHQQPASQQSQDSKFRWVIQQNLADLKKNPNNKPAKDSLTRYYEKGVLQRLGIDWKPEK